ncbi:hypothetical protein Tco_0413106 [Tanacetum coccineum]
MHLNEHIHLQEVTDQFRIEVLQPDIICIIGRVRDLIEFFLNSSFSTSSDTLLVSPNEVDILTWNFIPFKPNLTFMDEIVKSENMDVITIVTPSNVKKVESNHESADVKNNGDAVEPKTIRKNSFRPPVIKDWNSDDDSKGNPQQKSTRKRSLLIDGRISGKDGKVKVVSDASIRRHLKLEDSYGISTLSTSEIFEQLALMGYVSNSDSGEGSTIPVESHQKPVSVPTTNLSPSMPTTHVAKKAAPMPHDSPLLKTYGAAYTKLIMKVKKLEHKVKSIKARRKVRLVISDNEDDLEDPSKQGRKIAQIEEDKGITLVHMGVQTQGRSDEDLMYETGVYDYPKGFTRPSVSVTTAGEGVSTARVIPKEVSTAEPDMDVTLTEALLDLLMSGKKNSPKPKARADEQLVARVQAEEQELYSIEEKSRLLGEMIAERKRLFATQRVAEQRSKPLTKSQMRNIMCTYLRNMGGYKHNQLKGKSYEEIQKLFDKTYKQVNSFVPMESDDKDKDSEKMAGGRDDVAVSVESLATKYPTVDWKTHVLSEDKLNYEIIRANGSTKSYKIFTEMLDYFDREDISSYSRDAFKNAKWKDRG